MKQLIRKALALLFACLPGLCPAQSFDPWQMPDVVLGSRLTNSRLIQRAGGMAVDHINRKLYVADSELHRVLRFSLDEAGQTVGEAEAVLGRSGFGPNETAPAISAATFNGCRGLSVDAQGRLWVADTGHHRVLRFDEAWKKPHGAAADGVLGQPSLTSNTSTQGAAGKLWYPRDVASGPGGELYVADTGHHRVVRYDNAADKPAGLSSDGVIGQTTTTGSAPETTRNRMRTPSSVSVQFFTFMGGTTTSLWVADSGNHRVLMFTNPRLKNVGQMADKVLGQSSVISRAPAAGAHRMNYPLRVEAAPGQLWVADSGNNRVLRFDAPTAKPEFSGAADRVLGQPPDFNSTTPGTQMRFMDQPSALAVSQEGSLWVGDDGNHRVLHFPSAPSLLSGASAASLLGANLPGTFDDGMRPLGLAIDRQSGKLFVSDHAGHRVLRYKDYASLVTGAQPEAVFGQPDFSSRTARGGAGGLNQPQGLHMDENRRLWVADAGNHRVLRYSSAHAAPSGHQADKVLGQPDFDAVAAPAGPNPASMREPMAVWHHQNHLFVADTWHHRVVCFQQVNDRPNGAGADRVWGQASLFENRYGEIWQGSLYRPVSLCVTPAGDMWVVDQANQRVLGFRNVLGAYRRNADVVLGPDDFLSNDSSGGDGPQRMANPTAVAVDPAGRLWVADHSRLRCYEDEKNLPATGGQASFPLGQSAQWNASPPQHSLAWMKPQAIAIDPAGGGLWVAHGTSGRVMHYSPLDGIDGVQVSCGLTWDGYFHMTFNTRPLRVYRIQSSTDLKEWTPVATVIADSDTTTWTEPQKARVAGRKFFRVVPPE